jgi:nicotinate-nucleotide adenylyltransferase
LTPDLRGGIGVFGGTFDPIHIAHLAVAETARDMLGLDHVLFIPAGQPPHKTGRRISPAADRHAMVRAAIADNDRFVVSTIEMERAGPSYTVDTLRDLRAQRDTHDGAGERRPFVLILSAEAFLELPTWHEPEVVLQLAALAVAPRDGYPDAGPAFLADHFPGIETRAVFLDRPRLRLSASHLRADAAVGRSIRYLVPDAVADYIGDHELYRDRMRTTPS